MVRWDKDKGNEIKGNIDKIKNFMILYIRRHLDEREGSCKEVRGEL